MPSILKKSLIVFAAAMTTVSVSAVPACSPTQGNSSDSNKTLIPEGYIPKYDQAQPGTVVDEQTEQQFDVNGITFTVHKHSSIQASSYVPEEKSFFIDIDIDTTEYDRANKPDPAIEINTYLPNGYVAIDIAEMRRQDEYVEKSSEYIARNEPVPSELDTQYLDNHLTEGQYKKTLEIQYEGDGIYTVEIRDADNGVNYRVPMVIALTE